MLCWSSINGVFLKKVIGRYGIHTYIHTYIHRGLVRKFAFTLAEVLIVLGIIGIIAETTIPTLMNNVQDAQYKTGAKKAYSVLAQAQSMLVAQNGDFQTAVSGCSALDHTCFKNIMKGVLLTSKDCDSNSAFDNCFPSGVKYKNGGVADASYMNTPSAGAILADGMSIIFYFDTPNCSYAPLGNASALRCGWATVDVNGLKKPNAWGKDVYLYMIMSDKVLPASTTDIDTSVAPGDDCDVGTNKGYTCAAKYIMGN